MTSEALTEQRAAKASRNRTYRQRLTPEQKQALVDRGREQRHAREAKMTAEQREQRREAHRAGSARFRVAHGGEEIAAKQRLRRSRRRPPRAKTVAPVSARREKGIATEAENKREFEMAIRKVIAKAAAAGSLTTASDWFGLTPSEILATPLPPMRGNGWVLPKRSTPAAIAAALKAKAEGNPVSPSLPGGSPKVAQTGITAIQPTQENQP